MSALPILVIEDSDADAESMKRVIKRLKLPLEIRRCASGACALDYLNHRGTHANQDESPRPAFILLDYHLPDMRGEEVLEAIKSDDNLREIPVIAFSASADPRTVKAMYREGVSSFVPKPKNLEAMTRTTEQLMSYWLALVLLPRDEPATAYKPR